MDSASLANQISQYDKTPVNSVDALNSAMTQYGVPEMRQRVAGLNTTITNTQNALNSVDPSVTGRTQGSLVTEAQREKQVNNERAPIAQQLSDQNGALGTASNGLSDAEKNAQLLATNQVNDYNTGRQALVDQYNMASARETAAAQAAAAQAAAAQTQANSDRNYNLDVFKAKTTAANSAPDLSAGYKVANNKTGGLSFSGPNGITSMFQYAAHVSNNDPTGTYNIIKQLLAKSGDPSDKGAAAGIARLEQQGLSQTQVLQRLRASNPAIFD